MKKVLCAAAIILLCLGLLVFSMADINHGHGPGNSHLEEGKHEEEAHIVQTSH
jgi:hypothetical protein